jgi:hypothetical protein
MSNSVKQQVVEDLQMAGLVDCSKRKGSPV